MPADPSKAGKIGGKSKSAAKLAAARRNGFQKVTEAESKPVPTVEQLRRVIAVPAPSNRRSPKPQPTTATDELQQEPTSDDFTI
jgi:hypothetical protein